MGLLLHFVLFSCQLVPVLLRLCISINYLKSLFLKTWPAGVAGYAGFVISTCLCWFCVRETGERYRREMLAHGGGKEPMLMVEGESVVFVSATMSWRYYVLGLSVCWSEIPINSIF